MAGGLLNLIAIGNQNIILTGNPTKSFFKSTYAKYTNFGLQKYRIDQIGQNTLNLSRESKFSFKIPRYGDLLMDTYLVITLPNIWSPIYNYINGEINEFRPYQFKWVKNIGTQLIKEITISIGGHIIQKFSGSYLQNVIERDFSSKKPVFDNMIGNIAQLNDPANFSNRNGNYPNAWKLNDLSSNTIEPSIRENQLYIPINTWFTLLSTMALPLICLQYSELVIDINFRPIEDLFTIKDVLYDNSNNLINSYKDIPEIKASQNIEAYQFYRFINEPPKTIIDSSPDLYPDKRLTSNFDIHLLTTQCFLDNDERELFAKNTQDYLIKEVYEYNFEKVIKSRKIKLETNGLVSSWMWYFQRNDVNLRNEWSNYTNWPYENIIPNNLQELHHNQDTTHYLLTNHDISGNIHITGYEPDIYSQSNRQEIMKNFAIICDGKYREFDFPSGVYNKLQNYVNSNGNGKPGLYCYNFCLHTDPYKNQPSGAFNTNKFKSIELEYNTYADPPIDEVNVQFNTICDPETGVVIGTTKDPMNIYKYYYNLFVIEERYNILRFQSGTADLLYSR